MTLTYEGIEVPSWVNLAGKPYVTVSPVGLSTAGVTEANNGAGYGPDTPGTTTGGWLEAYTAATTGISPVRKIIGLAGTHYIPSAVGAISGITIQGDPSGKTTLLYSGAMAPMAPAGFAQGGIFNANGNVVFDGISFASSLGGVSGVVQTAANLVIKNGTSTIRLSIGAPTSTVPGIPSCVATISGMTFLSSGQISWGIVGGAPVANTYFDTVWILDNRWDDTVNCPALVPEASVNTYVGINAWEVGGNVASIPVMGKAYNAYMDWGESWCIDEGNCWFHDNVTVRRRGRGRGVPAHVHPLSTRHHHRLRP